MVNIDKEYSPNQWITDWGKMWWSWVTYRNLLPKKKWIKLKFDRTALPIVTLQNGKTFRNTKGQKLFFENWCPLHIPNWLEKLPLVANTDIFLKEWIKRKPYGPNKLDQCMNMAGRDFVSLFAYINQTLICKLAT